MSEEYLIFPEEETTIKLNTEEGQTFTIDIMDIDIMMMKVFGAHDDVAVLDRLVLVKEMCAQFKEEYDYNISKASMDYLLEVKHRKMDELKKNATFRPYSKILRMPTKDQERALAS